MGYTLLWLESLCTALLLLATIAALAARASKARTQKLAPLFIAFAMIALASLVTAIVGSFHFGTRIKVNGFGQLLAWSIFFVLGTCVLLVLGMRKGPENGPAARNWPLRKLLYAFAGLAMVTWITLANLDTAMKMQLTSLRTEVGARVLALAPARVPASENAAPFYLDAFELMAPESPLPSCLANSFTGWGNYNRNSIDPKSAEAHAFFRGQQAALALFRKGAAQPSCWFERDYSEGLELQLPELQQIQRGATLLAFDALVLATEGHASLALQDVEAIFRIARQLQNPILVSLIMATRIEEMGFQVLQDVLEVAPPTKEDLATFTLSPSDRYHAMLQQALTLHEVALGLSCFGLLSVQPLPEVFYKLEGGKNKDPMAGAVFGSSFYRVFMLASDLESYRMHMRELQDLSRRPYYEAVSDIYATSNQWRPKLGMIASLITPAMVRCSSFVAKGEAMHRLSRLGLAAAAYRLKHGKLPPTLDAMVPEFIPRIPTDPCDGKPMHMRMDGGNLHIYSIGLDLKDNGGKVPENPSQWDGADIVFRLKGN